MIGYEELYERYQKQLLEQWKERLEQFLTINEELLAEPVKKTRQKKDTEYYRTARRRKEKPKWYYRYCCYAVIG